MAEDVRLIFSNRPKKSVGSIIFDAFITESHERKSMISRYPIEDGSEISDHIVIQPTEISIEARVEAIGDGANILNTFQQLNDIIDNKELVSVVTGLKVYDNYHITSSRIPRSAINGGSLQVTLKLEEVKNVESQSVSIPISQLSIQDDITNKQAQEKQDIGKTTSGQTQLDSELQQIQQQAESLADSLTGG